MFVLAKNKNSNYFLDVLSFGGLPTYKGGLNDIIQFSKNSYYTYNSETEATKHIETMRREIAENSARYENSFKGATDKLLKVIDNLYIKEI